MEIFMYQKALAFFTKLYNNRDEVKYFGASPMKPKLPTHAPIRYPFPRTTPESVGIRSEHIYAFIKEITEKNLDKKGLPTDTDAYYTDAAYQVITHAPPKHPTGNEKLSALKKRFARKHPTENVSDDKPE